MKIHKYVKSTVSVSALKKKSICYLIREKFNKMFMETLGFVIAFNAPNYKVKEIATRIQSEITL